MEYDDPKAEFICKRFEQMANERTSWESHWQEVAERVLPSYSNSFTNSPNNKTKGDKRTEFMYDSTANIALDRFAAVMESMLTPRNSKWHRLVPSDPYLMKDRQTRLWFDEASNLLFKHRYAPKANFSSQNHENYLSLGAFGTGAVFIDKLSDGGLRYKSIHLGEIYFLENHQGIIDTAMRKFEKTARQAYQQWGDKCPEDIIAELEKNPDKTFEFIHAVMPREDLDPGRKDYRGMPFASYYIATNGKKVLEEGGYNTFPYAISRYSTAPGETYGRSPAMNVLPAIKVLNEEKKTLLKQGQRVVDPVLLAHDDGVLDTFSLKAGAINFGSMTADGKRLVDVLPTGNIAIGKDLMDDERAVINDAFLVTLFQILVDSPTMTATEVLERTREKGILLSPSMGRQQSEYLGPLIERELDVLTRQGMLPPMPPALLEARGEYEVEYDSPLSRAQKAEEASGLMRTIEMTLNVVNVTQNPEPLDFFNWDVIVPEISDIQAVPQRWLRAQEDVDQIRQGRAEQAQTQQMIEAAPAVAGLMKTANA